MQLKRKKETILRGMREFISKQRESLETSKMIMIESGCVALQISYTLLSRPLWNVYSLKEGWKFRARHGFSTGTVRGNASVIFAYIQTSFPHHVSAIRFGSPGNKYVLLIVSGQPIKEQWSWKYHGGVDSKNVCQEVRPRLTMREERK